MTNKVSAITAAAVASLILTACGSMSDGSTGSVSKFPSDDIRLVVSYSAGGPTDTAARAIAKYYEKRFNVTVVVENVVGASGSIGTAEVARAEPDGLTIGMTTESAVNRVPLFRDVGYESADLQPIGVATFGPGLIVVPAGSPYQTLDQLIAAAKANPGSIKIATAGTSTPQHVALTRMKRAYDVNFRLVPFEGEAPAITAVLGNNVAGCFCSNAQTTMAQIEEGNLRAIGTGAPEPLSYLPTVTPLAAAGFDKVVHGNSYFVLVSPAGTPKPIVEKLKSGLKAALNDPKTVQTIGEVRLLDDFIGASELRAMMDKTQKELEPILTDLFAQ